MMESDKMFKDLVKKIQLERGAKRKMQASERRITKAFARHDLSDDIARDIIDADLE